MLTNSDMLLYAFKGNSDAVDLALTWARVTHIWDDLIDRDKPVSNKEINWAFYALLIDFPNNPFYRAHMDTLLPLFAMGVMNYEIANQYEADGSLERLALAHVLRYSAGDVLMAMALIIGGPDWVREIGPELRQFIQPETLEHYLQEKYDENQN